MKNKENIKSETIRKQAIDFLSRKNDYENFNSFHQTLRQEIRYGLVPRSFEEKSNDEVRKNQRAVAYEAAGLLIKTGFLHNQQGLNRLGTIIEFSKIIKEQLRFEFKEVEIQKFCETYENTEKGRLLNIFFCFIFKQTTRFVLIQLNSY